MVSTMQHSSSTPATVSVGNQLLSHCCHCCQFILLSIIIGAIIFSLAGFIYVDMFYPKVPHFQVESLSLTNFTSSESVTGRWQVEFLVKNRNENLVVNYRTLKSIVYYQNVWLSESQIVPFRQGSMLETTLNITLFAVDVKVELFVLDDINREIEHGSIGFDVDVVVSIEFGPRTRKVLNLFSGPRGLHVWCSRVVVSISSNSSSGKLVGGARDCQVHYNS